MRKLLVMGLLAANLGAYMTPADARALHASPQKKQSRELGEQEIPEWRGGYRLDLPREMKLYYRWSIPFGKQTVRRDGIYVGDESVLVYTTNHWLYSLRKSDGVAEWVVRLDKDFDKGCDPVVTDQAVYVVIENQITCIDREEGKIRWRLDPKVTISATPVVIEPMIYFPAWGGRLYAYQIESNEETLIHGNTDENDIVRRRYKLRWEWQISADSHILGAPQHRDGLLYFGSEDRRAYAVTRDGTIRYKFRTQGAIQGGGVVTPNKFYVGSNDYTLYALNRLTGRPDWKFVTGNFVVRNPYADVPSRMVLVPSYHNGWFGVEDNKDHFVEMWHRQDMLELAAVGPDRYYALLSGNRLAAIDKKSGKTDWEINARHFRFISPTPNQVNENQPMRLWAVTHENIMVCFSELDEVAERIHLAKQKQELDKQEKPKGEGEETDVPDVPLDDVPLPDIQLP